MPIGFGFSGGDIAIAIQTLSKVYKGLKESGGSIAEYQEVSEFLKGLILTLQHLQRLEVACSDPSLVKAIESLSQAALKPIFEFLKEIEKYDWALGADSTAGRLQSTYKKTEWSLRLPKKVAKLKTDITVKMEPLHLLMESETLKGFDLTSKQLSILQKEFSSQAYEQLNFNAGILAAIKELKQSIDSQNTGVQTMSQRIPSSDPENLQEQRDGPSEVAQLGAPSARVNERQMREWRRIGKELCAVLNNIFITIRAYTKFLFLLSPQLSLFLRTFFTSLPRGSRLLIQDDIRFEDVLGREHILPYQYFSVWKIFNAFLKHQFEHQPGEISVNEGNYHILNSVQEWIISKNSSDWSRSVLPGSRIAMSVVLDPADFAVSCPRCRTWLTKPKKGDKKQLCTSCSWERYLDDQLLANSVPLDDQPSSGTRSLVKAVSTSKSLQWSAWIWSEEHGQYYSWAYDEEGNPHYMWNEEYESSKPTATGTNRQSSSVVSPRVLSLFRRVHAPLAAESDDPTSKVAQLTSTNDLRDEERIDNRFRRIEFQHRSHFFSLGRVFRILWTEPLGYQPGLTRGSTHFSLQLFDDKLHSEVRTFVVMLNKGQFSQCCPIHTYRGKGTLKAGIRADEHAMIYSGDAKAPLPELLPTEMLTMTAIRVQPSETREALDPASRINFGKVYAVEHNVKLLNLGVVSPEHQGMMREYFRRVMLQ